MTRDQHADRRSQLEAPASHRSNRQRRREARAARHQGQVLAKVATASYVNAAFWSSQALIAAGLLAPEPPNDERQAVETPAARAERAAVAAEFKAAVANSKMGEEASRTIGEALARFRDPKAAQKAAAAREKATDAARVPCVCGCGGTTRACTTPASHTQHPVAAPQIDHDGGTPGKAENSVAASTAETADDLGERPDETRTEPVPGTPDLGEKYEQRNNKLQRRMRILDEARAISTLPSVKACAVNTVSGSVAITQKGDGSGGFTGLFRCGSVWACPECMPVVRADRAALMEQYALAWGLEHDAELCTGDPADRGKTHTGHGMAMATLTSRHGKHAVLEDRLVFDRDGHLVTDKDGKPQVRPGQLQRTANAWRRMLQSRWWRRLRKEYGIVGATRALEVTHSWANGWHTHVHSILWFEEPVTDDVAKAVETEMYARWEAECTHAGLGRPTRKHGVKVDPARRGAKGAADLARYVVKVQDKDEEKAAASPDAPVNHISRDARPTADQARRLKDARTRRDSARAQGKTRAEADADALIADIREEIGQAARARALGNELLGGHNKVGRKDGRTSLEILRLALAGDDAERELYREFERATKGSRMLTWTGDVRKRLERLTGAVERDAQEVMQEDDAKGTKAVLVQVTGDAWKTKVAATPGRRGQVRVAVKVASDHAIQSGLDMETTARAVVRELLESWGLTWDTDMFGPDVDLSTGEMTGEHVVPQKKTDRRHPRWEKPDELEGNAAALGVTPREYVRPAQARRGAAGLAVARTLTTPAGKAEPTSAAHTCVACDLPVAPELGEPVHLLCDPFAA
ncbi:hypothetical protein [Streptomyces sp. WAC01280]|uniref:hypothetical protein n=1 Tax=Streptomyces sp. WAC01280 TaxID=2487424 RepID=UPI000F789C65|nr:hypothetical protein [Streptomyces sp. WAC01280]RSS50087.1 hypothetical protein EF909_39260 [Streptomyces sp. WAC01280]